MPGVEVEWGDGRIDGFGFDAVGRSSRLGVSVAATAVSSVNTPAPRSAIAMRLGFVLQGTHRKDTVTPAGEPRDTLVIVSGDDDSREFIARQQHGQHC